jgi:RNA polymerase sigma-70 factor (ECF subfamily)
MPCDWTEQLYRRYGTVVYRRARALLGSDHAAWDAVQEVFMRAARSESQFRHASSPTTWLYRITTNYCFNVLRDNRRRHALLADASSASLSHSAHAFTIAAASFPELRVNLARVLDQVPQELCEIAVYYYVDRMSQDEIATLIGTSRKTVGNRLREFHRQAAKLTALEHSDHAAGGLT